LEQFGATVPVKYDTTLLYWYQLSGHHTIMVGKEHASA
jgi:hypothetical protein